MRASPLDACTDGQTHPRGFSLPLVLLLIGVLVFGVSVFLASLSSTSASGGAQLKKKHAHYMAEGLHHILGTVVANTLQQMDPLVLRNQLTSGTLNLIEENLIRNICQEGEAANLGICQSDHALCSVGDRLPAFTRHMTLPNMTTSPDRYGVRCFTLKIQNAPSIAPGIDGGSTSLDGIILPVALEIEVVRFADPTTPNAENNVAAAAEVVRTLSISLSPNIDGGP